MFGKKKKENNEDSVVWCPPNESEVVDQSKMINSLAVFAKIDVPIYDISEKKSNIVEYKAVKETICHIVSSRNIGDFFNIDYESLSKQKSPLISKIIINKEKSSLLLKRKDYVVYGIPLECYSKYKDQKGDFFYMTILKTLGEGDEQIVIEVLNFDFFNEYYNVGSIYSQNGYFTRSIYEFIVNKLGEDIATEIFEETGLFDNELEL